MNCVSVVPYKPRIVSNEVTKVLNAAMINSEPRRSLIALGGASEGFPIGSNSNFDPRLDSVRQMPDSNERLHFIEMLCEPFECIPLFRRQVVIVGEWQ